MPAAIAMAKRKRTTKKTTRPKALDPATIQHALALRVNLHGDDPTLAALRDGLGLTAADADRYLAAAKERLTQEAGADRVEAFGEAVGRYNHLYRQALKEQDPKTALSAQNALVRLLGIANGNPGGATPAGHGDDQAEDLATIRAHLAPLGLADDDAPTVELARLAAIRLTDLAANGPPPRQ